MTRPMPPDERERRKKAAARAQVIGVQAAATEAGLPAWAVYGMLSEIGKRCSTPHHSREERRLIVAESDAEGIANTAAKYGITINTMRQWRTEFGAGARPTRVVVFRMLRDMLRGMSAAQVAERHGTQEATVYSVRRDAIAAGIIRKVDSAASEARTCSQCGSTITRGATTGTCRRCVKRRK